MTKKLPYSYQEVLFTYIQNGFIIPYKRVTINNATIYFPYITDYQYRLYNELHFLAQPMDEENNPNDCLYQDWEWFREQFHLKPVEDTFKGTVFVFLWGAKTQYVKPWDEHDEEVIWQLQQDTLNAICSDRIGQPQFEYHQPIHTHNGIGYTRFEAFNIETLEYTLKTFPRIEYDTLFIDYLKHQATMYSDEHLNKILSDIRLRYDGCVQAKTAAWNSYTKTLIQRFSQEFETPQQKQVLHNVLKYCESSTAITSFANKQGAVEYYELDYSEDTLKALCQALIKGKYLPCDTDEQDFVYYFSGKGKQPSKQLKWLTTNTELTIFLSNIIPKTENIWEIASKIFGNTKKNSLKSTNYTSKSQRNYAKYLEEIRTITKLIKQ